MNEYGELLRTSSRRIVELEKQSRYALENGSRQKQRLMISVLSLMKSYRITKIVFDFMQKNPDIAIHIKSRERRQTEYDDLINNRECELAFVRDQADKEDIYERLVLQQDRICVVLPANHPLASQDTVSLRQLEGETFIMLSPLTVVYRMAVRLCKEAGFEPSIMDCFEKADIILEMVSMGMGISILAETPIQEYGGSENIAIRRIDPPACISICLARIKEKRLSPEAQRFWDYVASLVQRKSA